MKLYNFARLINKYSVTFCLHREQGAFVSGKWEEGGALVKEMRGAIVPMNDRKIYQSGGTYDQSDRELFLTSPLPLPLSQWRVVYKDNSYAVEDGRDFADYSDAAVYNLKRIAGKESEAHA